MSANLDTLIEAETAMLTVKAEVLRQILAGIAVLESQAENEQDPAMRHHLAQDLNGRYAVAAQLLYGVPDA